MKRFYATTLLAVVLTAAAMATAKAALIADFGVLDVGGSGFIARPPLGEVPAGPFTDDYRFQVSTNAPGAAIVVEVENGSLRDIDGFTLALFSTLAPGAIVTDTGSNALEVAASSLSAGVQYFVRVTGNATGTAGGQYLGGLSIVPVPAALPLMLGALAGLGLIARRKTDA